jgi:tetratricopeptide (TPR) repeat protein
METIAADKQREVFTMLTKKSALICALVLLLLATGTADAAKYKARLLGVTVDPDGNPIEGVTVMATSDDLPDFNETRVTDKKGVFKIDFDEINVTYKYQFSKNGYITLLTEQVWTKDGSARHYFTLTPGESVVGAIGEVAVITSSAAAVAYQEAVAAFEAKDFATAKTKLEKTLEYEPELRQAWQALSVVDLELGDYAGSTAAAEKAIELGSTDMAIFRTRWEAYRLSGDEAKTAEAQADLEKYGLLAEEAKRIYNEGIALLKTGDKEGAFVKFEQALDADPNLEPALFAVATTGLETGKPAVTADAAERILVNNPGNEDALRLRYNAALELQDDEMLIDALVGLAPVEPEAAKQNLWVLAMAAYNANDNEKTKERFAKVLLVDPNNAQAHYLLGLVYLGEGAKEETREHLERFLALAPDDPDAASAREILAYLASS